jgi:hypothetical protein
MADTIKKILHPRGGKINRWGVLHFDSAYLTEISRWCHGVCRGQWNRIGYKFYFEDEADAMLFKLTWVGGEGNV